jgi:hypothetical protein
MKIVAGTPLVPPPGSATAAAAAAAATASTVASPPARQPLITAALYARQQAELGEEEPPEGAVWGEAGRGGDSTPVSAATTYKRAEKKRDDPLLVIIRHGKTGPSPHHSVEIIVPVLEHSPVLFLLLLCCERVQQTWHIHRLARRAAVGRRPEGGHGCRPAAEAPWHHVRRGVHVVVVARD